MSAGWPTANILRKPFLNSGLPGSRPRDPVSLHLLELGLGHFLAIAHRLVHCGDLIRRHRIGVVTPLMANVGQRGGDLLIAPIVRRAGNLAGVWTRRTPRVPRSPSPR